jgi:hypothetical protein
LLVIVPGVLPPLPLTFSIYTAAIAPEAVKYCISINSISLSKFVVSFKKGD